MIARDCKCWCGLLLLVLLRAGETRGAPEPDTAVLSQDAAVETAHNRLDSYWTYPWFDASDDSLRRMQTRRYDSWWPDWNWNFGRPSSGLLKFLLWTLLIAATIGIVYVLVRGYLRRQRGAGSVQEDFAERDDQDDAARVEELPFEIDPQGSNVFDLARYYYERGDFNRAIIYLYSHQLMELDRRHLIRLTKGKTNRQYLRELTPHAPLRTQLERTMLVFEEAFFGDYDVSRERFEACWQDVEEFSSMAQGAA